MKNIVITLCLPFLITFYLWSSGPSELSQQSEGTAFLVGVWARSNSLKTVKEEYSWGKARSVLNSSHVFDLEIPNPYVEVGGMGRFAVRDIQQIDDVFKLTVFFDREGKEYEIVVHKVDDNHLWIERMFLFGQGASERIDLVKIDGPSMIP